MTEGILNGISLALTNAFPAYPVYGDRRVQQGLEAPCFFVSLGECSMRPLPCGLLGVRQAVDVVYFPGSQEDFGEMWDVGPRALSLLEALALPGDGMVRGRELRCDIADGLMHMRAVYKLRFIPVENRGLMGEIAHQTRISR